MPTWTFHKGQRSISLWNQNVVQRLFSLSPLISAVLLEQEGRWWARFSGASGECCWITWPCWISHSIDVILDRYGRALPADWSAEISDHKALYLAYQVAIMSDLSRPHKVLVCEWSTPRHRVYILKSSIPDSERGNLNLSLKHAVHKEVFLLPGTQLVRLVLTTWNP